MPASIEDTGLSAKFLSSLLLKTVHMLGFETSVELAGQLKLSQVVVDQLLNHLKQQGLVEVRGSVAATVPVLRYALTAAGKDMAIQACRQCEYVGPAPVTLSSYQSQVNQQSITREKVTMASLSAALSHLVLSPQLVRRLGPAVNSGRAMLVYGPPGNGKTSISEAIGKVFHQCIYVPYCIEVDGQVIRIFDPTVHEEITPARVPHSIDGEGVNLLRKKSDPRWVKCRRPVVVMGGELTLEMLDLEYDPTSKFYEAPPQVKALGGVFIIDDFGRQLVQPRDLLNRWIVPLERRVDYLTIHTGKKFDLPFDELVIFSTNISPTKLMDPALLRRVKYKLRVDPPSHGDYVTIFRRVCRQHELELPEQVLSYLVEDFYPRTRTPFAAFHPIFIVEHALATCKYENRAPHLTLDLVKDALENLYVSDFQERDLATPLEALLQAKVS